MDATGFGAYLKQLRKAKKMTLREVARVSDVSYTYIFNIENCVRGIPSPELIRKLSTALGCAHIGMMIRAGHVTEEEVLTMRREAGINDLRESEGKA